MATYSESQFRTQSTPQTAQNLYNKYGSGPYVAEVVAHDSTRNGILKVVIHTKGMGNIDIDKNNRLTYNKAEVIPVKYASPFGGTSHIRFAKPGASDFGSIDYADTQHSYGMWMVPPDIGAKVLITFIENEPTRGYWFACIFDDYANNALPGFPAQRISSNDAEIKNRYGTDTDFAPASEVNWKATARKIPQGDATLDSKVDEIYKAFNTNKADQLAIQGLLQDPIRGLSTSSARREQHSNVFGISTPGPVDRINLAGNIGKIGPNADIDYIPTRLGGHSFIMDDGHEPVEGESNSVTEAAKQNKPVGEMIRLRSRTGHQILMHDEKGLIYISNAKGTAWIELSESGKIDIFSNDSISLFASKDLNFTAGRDVNIESKRNMNLRGVGALRMNSAGNIEAVSTKDFLVTTNDSIGLSAGNAMYQTSTNNFYVRSTQGDYFEETSLGFIHMNGPEVPLSPVAQGILLHSLPTNDINRGWHAGGPSEASKFLAENSYFISKRVPQHEPWIHHESLKPADFTSDKTDQLSTTVMTQNPGGTRTAVNSTASGADAAGRQNFDVAEVGQTTLSTALDAVSNAFSNPIISLNNDDILTGGGFGGGYGGSNNNDDVNIFGF
jgi:hypothetical protein